MTQPLPPWTPAPGSGIIVIFSPADRTWWFTVAIPQIEHALDLVYARLNEIETRQTVIGNNVSALQAQVDVIQTQVQEVIPSTLSSVVALLEATASTNDLRFQALQVELSGLTSSVEGLLDYLKTPARGHVRTTIGEEKVMPIPVHPSDTLAASVAWENVAGTVVPETGPTVWTAEDTTGAAFTAVTLAAGDDDDHETATFSDPAETASFVLVATMSPTDGSTPLVAKSDQIDVSPSNTPTQGVVSVTVTPGA